MKLIEPIDTNISHAFRSLGIEHITIIQKSKTFEKLNLLKNIKV